MSHAAGRTNDDYRASSQATRARRRAVDAKAFGVMIDGTTFELKVVDLSYDGCQVEASIWLLPGVRFKISILGVTGAHDALVRWSQGGRAGLEFDVNEDERERQHERIAIDADVSLRRSSQPHYQTRLYDLTPSGCSVEFVERPRVGEMLWLKFDGLSAIEAKVRWVDGFVGGLEFVRSIHPAVFELLVARLRRE